MRRHLILLASLAALAGSGAAMPLLAQQADSATIDRIVAIVGNKAILASMIEERWFTEFPGGKGAPQDPNQVKSIKRQMLDGLVDEELMVQEALKDTAIKVTDEQVNQSVDEIFRNARSKFQSEEAFRKDLQTAGFQTLEEWRSYLTEQQRREFLVKDYRQRVQQGGKFKPIPPTDKEMRDYFEQNKFTLPKQSEKVSLKQIVIAPKPSDSAKRVAWTRADSIVKELRKGADFATAAKRFSMDPGTREQGGSLSWIRRGQGWDPKFEEAAFLLRPGQVSDPVESAFGYHIIQVERTQPAEVQVRHILLMPVIDSVEADSAQKLANAVAQAIKQGASFDSLQRLYHDKAEERDIQQFPLDQLPPQYRAALTDVPVGSVSPVFRLEAPDPLRSKYAVLLVTGRIPAGEVRFQDVQDQLRSRLGQILAWKRVTERLRRATFVEVREL
jgi:peptidyl-prolyl cis-trans isomerase SurA